MSLHMHRLTSILLYNDSRTERGWLQGKRCPLQWCCDQVGKLPMFNPSAIPSPKGFKVSNEAMTQGGESSA